jgi:hypothetical protein
MTTMNEEQRSEYVTRDSVLKLLSDDEIARVSTAEAAPHLAYGDEYLDLGQLQYGVRRAGDAPTTTMERVLPRKAVQEATWTTILTHLAHHAGQPSLHRESGDVAVPSTAREHSVVGVFASHVQAETAIKALEAGGADMKKLSIIGRSFHSENHAVGFYTSGNRMMFWGGQGAFLGSLWGILFGGAFFFIPGVGPLVAMGPMASWIIGALEGAMVGGAAGVLAATLVNLGLPEEQMVQYETDIKSGKFLVLARGSAAEMERAQTILGASGASLLAAQAV